MADSRSYSLLDVDRQLKIPLMSISSLDNSQPGGPFGQTQNIAGDSDGGLLRSSSSATARPNFLQSGGQSHARSTSLGDFITGAARKPDRKAGEAEDAVFQDADSPKRGSASVAESSSRAQQGSANKPLPAPPRDPAGFMAAQTAGTQSPARGLSPPKPGPVFLRPHIASPSAEEFLIVTGTGPLDPGIGMFVNLDGDPTRPTVEFDRYPREIVVDGGGADPSSSRPSLTADEEGYVLASMAKEFDDGLHQGLEIQSIDVNVGEGEAEKFWLEIGSGDTAPSIPVGMRSLLQTEEMKFEEVVDLLCQRRFSPFSGHPSTPTMSLRSFDSRTAMSMERLSQEKELFDRDYDSDDEPLPEGWESKRNKEGEEFVRSLAKTSSRLAIWAGADIWWGVRNPLLLQLESALETASTRDKQSDDATKEKRRQLISLLGVIKDRDAKNELEFMTLGYIKQRASVMLLETFLDSTTPPMSDGEVAVMEINLIGGDLDARVVLALIPALRNEIVVSRRGIWIYGGVKNLVQGIISGEGSSSVIPPVSSLSPPVLQFLKRFLTAWRKKKGFGSIPAEVFRTVDASLLLVLLELDQDTPRGQTGKTGTIRKELYDLVDNGVDCFERAVDLLETYRRLFVLSRLYQHRKMSSDVLGTWRRIIEGEEDRGGELGDGEQRVRGYLANISNQPLVQEYGLWLAARNPKLGVQVFADDKGRAPRFEPTQVVELLKEEAPDAVKYYLEHLVFGKGNRAYVNELIAYYLDIVVNDLLSNSSSREMITSSYEAYSALRPPKPTYVRFLTDNAPPDDDIWQSRLRLLQLLGEGHDYDASAIWERIDTALSPLFENNDKSSDANAQNQLLVPEAIILNGRAKRHEDSLRLLVHRLGDYDTAVSYCLSGGASLSGPIAGRRDSIPTREVQTRLFRVLLSEFLSISDLSDRVEQTGALLERFGGWFDVLEVLPLIPDSWSVDVTAGFLIAALRGLVRERQESMVIRSLSGAENLRVNYDLLSGIDEKGPVIDTGS